MTSVTDTDIKEKTVTGMSTLHEALFLSRAKNQTSDYLDESKINRFFNDDKRLPLISQFLKNINKLENIQSKW